MIVKGLRSFQRNLLWTADVNAMFYYDQWKNRDRVPANKYFLMDVYFLRIRQNEITVNLSIRCMSIKILSSRVK